MTEQEIDNMPAGREMDALIAEKVMMFPMAAIPHALTKDKRVIDKGDHAWLECKCYSTDIAAAWEVVEKLMPSCEQGNPEINRGFDGKKPAWHVYFDGGDRGHAIGETISLAICRAALLATIL